MWGIWAIEANKFVRYYSLYYDGRDESIETMKLFRYDTKDEAQLEIIERWPLTYDMYEPKIIPSDEPDWIAF